MGAPYFTIVMPSYNREASIARAVDSCLSQSFADFELLVVDDGSTDGSVGLVQSYRDPRVHLLQHDTNRGPCPARNTAIARARGQWCVMLDSDFALRPGALHSLFARCEASDASVGNVASACSWDTGEISPWPRGPDQTMSYSEYLTWLNQLQLLEYFNCIRRTVFDSLRYPDSRAWELEFHFDLARRWKLAISGEPIVTVYTDAANRLTADRTVFAADRLRKDAADKLASLQAAVRKHGAAFRSHAPALYVRTLTTTAHQAFTAGHRRIGIKYLLPALLASPTSIKRWGLLATGLLGSSAVGYVTARLRRA